ncbi:glycogen debranching protein GlgX [Stomatohabitans albus]|uniref:glycogen debranching protein GlgX n=1 Tax=Stomatohabitans albus TaxID=3110766 RepID=UPI00300D1C6E
MNPVQGGLGPLKPNDPGLTQPFGVHWDGRGSSVRVYSTVAKGIDLCLFDDGGVEHRVPLENMNGGNWGAWIAGLDPGTHYGFRVDGPWDPDQGHRCNPKKLLMDPWGRAFDGWLKWDESTQDHTGNVRERNDLNNANVMPRSVVIDPVYRWRFPGRPNHRLRDSVIYELHVKGFTATHPDVPKPLRGTYAGLAHPAVIDHFKRLGVTAIELLPVHQYYDDGFLVRKGLTQYWGYNSVGFFAPHSAYSSLGTRGEQVTDFKYMVDTLHANGIEVILDVVYNHTGEADMAGPVINFKGFDNRAWYWLGGDRTHYVDFSGCGNTPDMRQPQMVSFIMDSLRYWVTEMGVDGFRFDLASTMARGDSGVQMHGPVLSAIHQDPVLQQVKLIAEPWDLGGDGYRLGDFPHPWSEWNGGFRDQIRSFWLLDQPGQISNVVNRVAGSQDTFAHNMRTCESSINFVTAHDGFTLNDLVSYEERHNHANFDDNSSGDVHNHSSNHGVEGPTDDPAINAIRARQQRNLLATLMLSIGVPMLLGGDDIGNTQYGNNNPYCVDAPLSWIDWEHADSALFAFTSNLVHLRRNNPVLRRHAWLQPEDVRWLRPDGKPMESADWHNDALRTFTMHLLGDRIDPALSLNGVDQPKDLVAIFNADTGHQAVTVPGDTNMVWEVVVDTAESLPNTVTGGSVLMLEGRSVAALSPNDRIQ